MTAKALIFKIAVSPFHHLCRSILTQILKMLIRINAKDEAIAMATKYKLIINS